MSWGLVVTIRSAVSKDFVKQGWAVGRRDPGHMPPVAYREPGLGMEEAEESQ